MYRYLSETSCKSTTGISSGEGDIGFTFGIGHHLCFNYFSWRENEKEGGKINKGRGKGNNVICANRILGKETNQLEPSRRWRNGFFFLSVLFTSALHRHPSLILLHPTTQDY
jgi:hypothetical protein